MCRRPLPSSSSRASARSTAAGRSAGRAAQARSIEVDHRRGQVGAELPQRRQPPGGDVAQRLGRGLPAQRVPPGQQLVQHHARRVHVAGRAHAAAGGLLRRHVGDSADDVAVLRQRVGVHEAGDAEVHDLDVAGVAQHHVLRLDVAVDDALAVGERQGVEQLRADGRHVVVAQAAVQPVERLALDELPHQHLTRAVAEPVVQGDDVGVRERGGGLDLARRCGRTCRAPRRRP